MTALVLLSHEPPGNVARMVEYWQKITGPEVVIVAYGGKSSDFGAIPFQKAYIDDPRLRTQDHQRERQSYTKVLCDTVAAISDRPWKYLYLAEYDMLPISPDLWRNLECRADQTNADLLAHRAWRIDDTLHPHFSDHLRTPGWLDWISTFSRRSNKSVVLSCMGCGQWWRRAALEAVIGQGEPIPTYLEVHLPTVAHHLGFRIRGMGDQDTYVTTEEPSPEVQRSMAERGALVIHPLKRLWESDHSTGEGFQISCESAQTEPLRHG